MAFDTSKYPPRFNLPFLKNCSVIDRPDLVEPGSGFVLVVGERERGEVHLVTCLPEEIPLLDNETKAQQPNKG